MLEALEEMQIPVDAIGGCSIGSFIGGLYAREGDLLSTTGRTKQVDVKGLEWPNEFAERADDGGPL